MPLRLCSKKESKMKRLIKKAAFVFSSITAFALSLTLSACAQKIKYADMPVYSGPLVQRRADPCVYKHTDGYYYFTNSYEYGSWNSIKIRKALTINGLRTAEESDLLSQSQLESWGVYGYYWAPELRYINGVWYLFFNASESSSSSWTQRCYVASSGDKDPVTGTWRFLGKVQAQKESSYNTESGVDLISSYALGGTVFCAGGQWYYLWTQTVNDGDSVWDKDGVAGDNDNLTIETGSGKTESFADLAQNTKGKNNWQCLFIGKTDPRDFTRVTDTAIIAVPQYDWECGTKTEHSDTDFGNTIDQPAVIVRDKKVTVLFSASDTDDSYCMGLLTASEDAPLCDYYAWKKSEEPFMETDSKKSVYGPGSPCFTKDGDYDVLVFAARPSPCTATESYNDKNRATYAVPLGWSKDGTPVPLY